MLTEELADEVLYRWQWQIPEQPAEIDWVGSPVLDGSGCVVGVVSRRAPAANAHIQSEHDVDRLDVVSVQQLRDLITEPLE